METVLVIVDSDLECCHYILYIILIRLAREGHTIIKYVIYQFNFQSNVRINRL